MAKLVWDQTGQKFFETGVDHGVLYVSNGRGGYLECNSFWTFVNCAVSFS